MPAFERSAHGTKTHHLHFQPVMMISITGETVTDDFRINFCATLFLPVHILRDDNLHLRQSQNHRAFIKRARSRFWVIIIGRRKGSACGKRGHTHAGLLRLCTASHHDISIIQKRNQTRRITDSMRAPDAHAVTNRNDWGLNRV